MRGAAARLICLGLAGATTVAAMSGSPAHAAPEPKQGCAWHRHSKGVVAHERRHGRVRKVKRVRHWWTCDPVLQTVPPVVPIEGLPLEEAIPTVGHLGVKAAEWSYTLSRPEVTTGEVIVELDNQGEDNHNLRIQREGSGEPPLEVAEAAPSQQTSARFTLQPGTYHLYCSLYQHDEKGMHATLVVRSG